MKLLFDFFPVIVFFIVFKRYEDPQEGILAATLAIVIATLIQMAVTLYRTRKIEKMHAWTLAIVVFFGGLTLYFENPMFIKWKPTIVNWLFAVAFAGSQWFTSRSIVRRILEGNVSMAEHAWAKLNWAWVAFFTFCGAVNLYVVYNYSTDTWVDFKLFGMFGLTAVFMVVQVLLIMKYADDPEPEPEPAETTAAEDKAP